MQMSEVQRANMETEMNWRIHRQEVNASVTMYDAIWGEVRLTPYAQNETRSRRWGRIWTRLIFASFPSIVMTCRCCCWSLEKKPTTRHVAQGWTKQLLSWSFLFAAVQIFLMAYMTAKYGMVTLSENKMAGPGFVVFNDWGAKNAAEMRYENEWWRMLTAMFVHAGWFHLLSNVLMQLHLGTTLEIVWGHTNWLLVYLLSGFEGWLASAIFMSSTIGVGSSGALCGLIGAWVPFLIATWNQTLPRDRAGRNAQLAMVLLSIMVLIPLSFAPMVDAAAHMGGLIMGFTVASALFAGRVQTQTHRIAMRTAGIVTTLAVAVVSVVIFFNTDVDKRLLNLCPADGCPEL
mmetsp:Transcript_1690/g.5011  ORF Transcript_1690/g.5011 Transcript_1690/m.5011 type:complete len:346 (+) Transcript_1690:492-1529(+)